MNYNFQDWIDYYERHKEELMEIPWEDEQQLTAEESAAIYGPIRLFQKGETSEGKFLLGKARGFCERVGDNTYAEALKGLIKEEHRHSRDLGKIMDQQGIPRQKDHWVDGVFCALRNYMPLEYTITVLLTAELYAAVFYPALKKATKLRTLRKLCEQIEIDEEQHINFQCELVGRVQSKKGFVHNWFHKQVHRVLMLGTGVVVWWYNRSVFTKAKMSLFDFAAESYREYWKARDVIARVRGYGYQASPQPQLHI